MGIFPTHSHRIAVLGKYDEKKGGAMARKDWLIDSQGHEHLDFKRFRASWFQLADMWTKKVDEAEYYQFLPVAVLSDLCVCVCLSKAISPRTSIG